MIGDPWFYAVAVPAVVLTGFSKAGFGGAVGGLAVPLMSLAIAPPQAVAVMLPILLLMDVMGLYAFRGKWDAALLKLTVPAGLLGTLIGALTFHYVNERWLRGLIGIEAVVFALQKFREGSRAWNGPPAPLRPAVARFWSTVSGFTSFVSHAGGPPMMQFLLPLKLDRVLLVATLAWYFAVINAAKWLPYGLLGLIDVRNLSTSLALLPVVPIGYVLGLHFLRRVPQGAFVRLATWALLLTGCKLIRDAVAG